MKKTFNVTKEGAQMPFPFSHAAEAGNYVYLSGQPSMELETGKFIEGSFEQQLKQCFSNLERVLKEAGLDKEDVIKCTVFLVDMRDYIKMNEYFKEYFSYPYPSRSCLAVAGLPLQALVEVEMIAYRK